MGSERPGCGSGARPTSSYATDSQAKERKRPPQQASALPRPNKGSLATALPCPIGLSSSTLFPVGEAHLLCLGRRSCWVHVYGKSKERERELVRQKPVPGAETIPIPLFPAPQRNQGACRIPCLPLGPSLLSKLPTCPACPTPPPWSNLRTSTLPTRFPPTPALGRVAISRKFLLIQSPGVAQMTDLRAQQLTFTDNMTGPSHPWGAGSPSRQMASLEPWLEGYKSLGLVPLAETPAKQFHLGPDRVQARC